jgi:DNA repair protein RadC
MWWIVIIVALIIISAYYNKPKHSIRRKRKETIPPGKIIQSPISSKRKFLDSIGRFLKHKKHEWVFVAFLKNYNVCVFEVYKGSNRDFVEFDLDFNDISNYCRKYGYNKIIVGHNHPNGVLSPSKQDRRLLKEFRDFFDDYDISVEHYLFVAGNWKKYELSFFQMLSRL